MGIPFCLNPSLLHSQDILQKDKTVLGLFFRGGLNLDGTYFETIIPFLEFSTEFQSNKLIYHKENTKRQQIIYVLIKHLYNEEGFGYRKILWRLNNTEIKIHRASIIHKIFSNKQKGGKCEWKI